MKDEIWKDIRGFEGYYQVSNLGNVKSLDRIIVRSNNSKYTSKGKMSNPVKHKDGYHRVNLRKEGVHIRLVHRVVMESFIGTSKLQVNHVDGNKSNNNLLNLEYVTHLENMNHASTVLKGKKRYGVRSTPSGKWRADIRVGHLRKSLGTFSNKEEAYKKFYEAYLELHNVVPWEIQ